MKLTKTAIAVFLIIILNIVIKGLGLGIIPHGIATEELALVSLLHIHSQSSIIVLRFISLFVTTVIPILFFFGVQKRTKNTYEAFAVSLALSVHPWIYMLSRFFNPYIFILLIVSLIFCFVENKRLSVIGYFSIPFIAFAMSLFKFGENYANASFISNFLQIFDTRTLFFSGDYASFYLRIPSTGFFMMADILPFIFGVYYAFNSTSWKKHHSVFFSLIFSGIVFFMVTPQSLPAIRSSLLFLSFSLFIGLGYYFIAHALKHFRLAFVAAIFLLLANIFFYQELFLNHFDNRNSTEWGYAKIQAVNYLKSHREIKAIYITRRLGNLEPYLTFLYPSMKRRYVEDDKIKIVCTTTGTACIVTEEQLSIFNKSKEQVRKTFDSYGGLPEFFLL